MTNIKVIRGEDNKYEYIKNSYNIKFNFDGVMERPSDCEDISEWVYNPCLVDQVPIFEILYTYVKFPDEYDDSINRVGASRCGPQPITSITKCAINTRCPASMKLPPMLRAFR